MTVAEGDHPKPPAEPATPFSSHGLLAAACRRPLGLVALLGAILSASVLILGEWFDSAAIEPVRHYGLAALSATSALFVWVLVRVAATGADPVVAPGPPPRPVPEPPAVEGERWRMLGDERLEAGDPVLAAAAYERALSLSAGAGDALGEAAAERRLAALARRRGDPGHAEWRLRRAYDRAGAASDSYGMAVALIDLGDIATDAGRDDLARHHFEEARRLLLDVADAMGPRVAALLGADPGLVEPNQRRFQTT
jgi:tetratricopeptide (TPR) repeat protein